MKAPIAVVGMAALFPEAHTPEQFWENLLAQKDCTTLSTVEDFGHDPDVFYDPEKGKLDKCYSLKGGYIRDFRFDPEGYLLDSQTLAKLDDLYKWTLYVANKALEDSGYRNRHEILAKCGVILGNLSFPTRTSHQLFAEYYTNTLSEILQKVLQKPDFKLNPLSQPKNGNEHKPLLSSSPTPIVAAALGLGGTHFSLDAACASSLYAVKLACDELLNGKADLMLAGAVSGADPLFIHMGFSIFQAYSKDSQKSAPFDKDSAGLISSEGAGMLVLKRYEDAVRDGDRIYATILNVGLSNDGKGKFLLSPNPKGQQLAFERAYEPLAIQPHQIDYLECHATGTPLGDSTEINSIESFFAKDGKPPLIGSVKSNIGHLLTVAGISSMIKTILAMQNNKIPATIKLSETIRSSQQLIGYEQIVKENIDWQYKEANRKEKLVGVNSFGFGGTNAHAVLSSATPPPAPSPVGRGLRGGVAVPMAIVGMDIHVGSVESLEQFYQTIYEGKQLFRPLPPKRWKGFEQTEGLLAKHGFSDLPQGAFLESFEIDLLRFKIQPNEAEHLEPQQTLILKVADNALKNAGFDTQYAKGGNVAVIVAMESELAIHHYLGRWDLTWQLREALEQNGIVLSEEKIAELEKITKDILYPSSEGAGSASQHTGFIGNIMTARISSLWDFSGASFTVSSGENSVLKALQIAQSLLAHKEVDAVVVAAVDLAGGMENVLTRNLITPYSQKHFTMSWDSKSEGCGIGEGAGAIVLKRAQDLDPAQDRAYAIIENLETVESNYGSNRQKVENFTKCCAEIHADQIGKAVSQLLEKQGLSLDQIGYWELAANAWADEAEQNAVCQLSKTSDFLEKTTALGSSKANVGNTLSASGIVSLIKTALCIYHQFLPAVPNWTSPKNGEIFEKTAFYFPNESRPWVLGENQTQRQALINSLGTDNTAGVILLVENTLK